MTSWPHLQVGINTEKFSGNLLIYIPENFQKVNQNELKLFVSLCSQGNEEMYLVPASFTSCQGPEGISVCVLSRARGLVLAFASRFVSEFKSGIEAARWRSCQLVVMVLIGSSLQFIRAPSVRYNKVVNHHHE